MLLNMALQSSEECEVRTSVMDSLALRSTAAGFNEFVATTHTSKTQYSSHLHIVNKPMTSARIHT